MNFIRPQINVKTLTVRGNTIISNNDNTSSPVLSMYKSTGVSMNIGVNSSNYANINFLGGALILGINGSSGISITNSLVNYLLPLTLSGNLNISNLSSSSQTTINLSGILGVTGLTISYTNPSLTLTAFSSQTISINTTGLTFNSTITTNGIISTSSVVGNQIFGLSTSTSSNSITLTNTSNNIQLLTGTSVTTLTLTNAPSTGLSYNIYNTGNLPAIITGTMNTLPAKSSAKFIYNGTDYSIQNWNNITLQTIGGSGYLYNSMIRGNVMNIDTKVFAKRIKSSMAVVNTGLSTWNTGNTISTVFAITNITGTTSITFTCRSSNFVSSMVNQTVYINTADTTPELNGYFNIASVISATQFTVTTTLTTITSTLGSITILPALNWSSICWSGDLSIFVMGNNGGNTVMASSTDAITWSPNTVSNGIGFYNSICWSSENSLFVGVSNNGGAASTTNIITSPNGTTWIQLSGLTSNVLNSVCWCPEYSLFVAVGGFAGTGYTATSPNGSIWTITSSTNTGTTPISATSICWSPELLLFVVTNGTGNIYYSNANIPTAMSWATTSQTGTGITFTSVVWSPELYLFVAIGSSSINTVYTSPNGINWTSRSTNVTMNFRQVIWAQELSVFVATGSNGIVTSANGIAWVTRNTGNDVRCIEWSRELSELVTPIYNTSNILSTNPILVSERSSLLTNPGYLNVNSTGQLSINSALNLTNNVKLIISGNQTDRSMYINRVSNLFVTMTLPTVGTYIFTASNANVGEPWDAYTITSHSCHYAFDGNINSFWGEFNNWDSTTRNYNGTVFTTLSNGTLYYGAWLQVQLPSPIILASFSLAGRQDQVLYLFRTPTTFIIVGSNDNITWNLIHTADELIFGPGSQSYTVNGNNTNAYTYFRICINKVGNSTTNPVNRIVDIAEWRLITSTGDDAIPTNQIGQQQLCITSTTNEANSFNLMIDTTNNVGIIQTRDKIVFNPDGGSIGIGTNSPSYLLDIQSQSAGPLPHLRMLMNFSPTSSSNNYRFMHLGNNLTNSQSFVYLQCRMEKDILWTNLTNTVWIGSQGGVGLVTVDNNLIGLIVPNGTNVSNDLTLLVGSAPNIRDNYCNTIYIFNTQPNDITYGLTYLNTNTGSVLTLTINGIINGSGGVFITITTSSFTANMVGQMAYITGTNCNPSLNQQTHLINKVVSGTRIFIRNLNLSAINNQNGTLIMGPGVGYFNGVGYVNRFGYTFGMMTSNTSYLYGSALSPYDYRLIPTYQVETTGTVVTHKYTGGEQTGSWDMHYNICDTIQSGSGMGFILGRSFPTTTTSINDTSITTACRVITNRDTANYMSYGFGGTVGITMNNSGNFSIGATPTANYTLDVNGSATMSALYVGGIQPSNNLVFFIGGAGISYNPGGTSSVWPNTGAITSGASTARNTGISSGAVLMVSGNLIVTSDKRIKQILNEKIDLSIIDSIETISYKHKDIIRYNRTKIGFSAQQIKTLDPNAVSFIRDYIPNIYKVFELKEDCITYKQHNLKINTNLKLILLNNEELCVKVIKIIDNNTIQIDKSDIKQSKIFIYGEMIEDLHRLDYNQIYYYTIGGIQQLRKDNIRLQNEIDEINKTINTLLKVFG